MVSYLLITIFSVISAMHFAGVCLTTFVIMKPSVKMSTLTRLFIFCVTAVDLFVSDILTVLSLVNANSKFRGPIIFMQAYGAMLFMCLYFHISQSQLASILKGVARTFYRQISYFLITRLTGAVIGFFVGVILCSLASEEYLQRFTAIYYTSLVALNILFSIIALKKMQFLRTLNASALVGVEGTAVGGSMKHVSLAVSASGVSNSVAVDEDGVSQKSQPKPRSNTLAEVERTFQYFKHQTRLGIIVQTPLVVVLSTILMCVFRDNSYESGLIISIPWLLESACGILGMTLEQAKKLL